MHKKSILILLIAGMGIVASAFAGDEAMVVSPVEKVADGFLFTEGPVWHKDGYLLFSDIPAHKILQWSPSGGIEVFREPSGDSNGLAFDRNGRLIACEHGNRRVSRTESDGSIVALAERYEGKRLNSPNDLVVRSDGTLYFTDPDYGVRKENRELDFNGVFCLKPNGELVLLEKDFNKPNGIVLSPDEKWLYVADTAESHVRSFEVQPDGSVKNGKVLTAVPFPDGMAIDAKGNLYVTAQTGVEIFDPAGKHLTVIAVPEQPANCGFGGKENKTLYITARKGLYKVEAVNPGLSRN